ncbi:sulfatase-like hydrolase/transferase [Alienimonas chondri]|uniref:Sulfatase N-terminal domain-containing protein n=1 Tax=Alienimonas chondri TaxID=2681879 RepID=A0ABX1VF09_9PLAN|nr:sulfatase-like hydrolase/transferase [Alienimonas chondri]NNJ26667.1 hypothetical protein [Alienimonas chondri]
MSKNAFPAALGFCIALAALAAPGRAAEPSPNDSGADDAPPNVLFIAMDDLNDWIGCLGGHPQALTPNLDRLAASGVLFTNAHCAAPACNPSRSAIFTGRAPNVSGLYENGQAMREIMPDAVLLPNHFRQHGYRASGSGKMLHYFIDAQSWDEYFPAKETENPFPETFYPKQRPVSLPRGGPWQYVETDWAALDVTDEEFGGDHAVSGWIGEQLSKEQDQPFFLACGIYRPHEPWFVPKQYFEPFPLDSVQLPPGYLENDLDDVPAAGVKAAKNRYFAHIQEQDQWRQGVQGYLASIHFADAMLGRVLDALEAGPNADDTIVVLWSDHGWQLGEKEHWQKYTPWRAVTRVPLMVRVPEGVSPTLPAGTTAGGVCGEPVNLLGLFPTLTELCGVPSKEDNDGHSLLPLLKNPTPADPATAWPHVSTTFLSKPGSYAVSGRTHRYIRYAEGGEELYDTAADPYEWTNLLAKPPESLAPAEAAALASLKAAAPADFAEYQQRSINTLIALALQTPGAAGVPPSKPDGGTFPVYFINESESPVELFWSTPEGGLKSYGTVGAGKTKSQQTRPGAVWAFAAANRPRGESPRPRGYFVVDDRKARAVIPAAP